MSLNVKGIIEKGLKMSLIKCKECGEKISSSAKICPHCGKKQNTTNWKAIFYGIIALYAIGFVNYLIRGTPEVQHTSKYTYNSSPEPVSKTKLQKTLKGNYYACISEELFDEISMAAMNKDNLAVGTLLSKGCVLTKSGVRFSYIGSPSFGVAKIRAYDGQDSIILYTNHENVYY